MSLTRLLQLASPALPVGAYTYSQGLEWAVEAGMVKDEVTALQWIGDQLEWNLGRFEAPLLDRMMAAWKLGAGGTAHELDAQYLASRESAELRAETLQMGHSLRRLIDDLGEAVAVPPNSTFMCAWSALAAHWLIEPAEALTAWLWSWAENQTMAALKAVPLGQAAGQRILLEIGERIPAVVERALALEEDDYSNSLSNFSPGFAIACACHETQYSRLFRS
ncbi:MAG: urease accessory protein UreF [Pseudomonadota bacterium]